LSRRPGKRSPRTESLRAAGLALAAGAVFPAGFAPFGLWPVALLSLVVVFALWRARSPRACAALGFAFGAGAFGTGVSWVYVSMHTFGGMQPWLAATAVALFTAYLALFPAFAGYLQARLAPASTWWRTALAAPAAWVLVEWLRGTLFTGFPWLGVGYAFIDTPLAALAPVLGSHGVGLAAAITAGLLALAARRRPPLVALAAPALIWLAAVALARLSWGTPAGAPIDVALVQANVPLATKWSAADRARILDRYLDMSRSAGEAALVVWPEAAVPGFLDELDADFWAALTRLSRGGRTQFLFGALEREVSGGERYFNSLAHFDGRSVDTYRKHHLVPFGEYVPLVWLARPLLHGLSIPMSDLSAGPDGPQPLRAGGIAIGASICYEDAFARDIRRTAPGAGVLVNVSEDAWFGDSLGPHQRLQMARMRSRELALPMLRAGNTGPSVVIDARGRVIASARQFSAGVLRASVQPMAAATPFARYGEWPFGLLAATLVAAAWLARRRRR